MSIILPHTDLDIPFFRSDGKCYQRTQQGVALTPNESWENMASPSDFGIHGSCEACHNAILSPYTCPCDSSWVTLVNSGTPCGDPNDLLHKTYLCSTVSWGTGACLNETSWDTEEWDGTMSAETDHSTCFWGPNGPQYRRIPGTNKAFSYRSIRLRSTGWEFSLYSSAQGAPVYYFWVGLKKYGSTPEGVYERTNGCAIFPTAITFSPVIP